MGKKNGISPSADPEQNIPQNQRNSPIDIKPVLSSHLIPDRKKATLIKPI